MRILCLGECMVEMAPTGDNRFTLGFAGDTFNTAWALRKTCPRKLANRLCNRLGR